MVVIESSRSFSSAEAGPPQLHVAVDGTRLVLEGPGWSHRFHAAWLRQWAGEFGAVDPRNGQRLWEPTDVAADLAVRHTWLDDDTTVGVMFNDEMCIRLSLHRLLWAAGHGVDPIALPHPLPWSEPIDCPTLDWGAVERNDTDALVAALSSFHRHGWFVIVDAPTSEGSLVRIAERFGRVSATNFGTLFDVRSDRSPIDLAYTAVALSAHTDQPYRRPTPAIQFLHTLVNDAIGGHSTVVDGLAAVSALRCADPVGFESLTTTPIEFRYDIGTDVVIDSAPMIELAPDGSLRQLRYSPRLDFVPAIDVDALDHVFRARRWLAEWFADDAHRVEFKMGAGDVLVADNHRVLHGRTAFDPSTGHRHLQGCYIDHDGPATMWRLLCRARARLDTCS